MIKLLGICCLIMGFFGLSFDRVREEATGIKRLAALKSFVIYLLREIEYSHIPIPDICKEYQDRSDNELRTYLEKICKQYENSPGKSYEGIWNDEAENIVWKKEEKLWLKKLGKCFGYCNIGMQLAAIEQYLQDIEKQLLQKEKKFQDNRKLILYFGVMSGLLLSIILL